MVRVAFDGQLVDELQRVGERIRYRLQFRAQDRGRMETLENLVPINDAGQPVYLRSVADIEIRPGEAAVRHYLGQRTLTLYGEIIGVGPSDAMLDQARQLVDANQWGDVQHVRADAAQFEFPQHPDAVLSTFTLTLIPDCGHVIANASRALAPGGRIVVLDMA